MPKVIRLLCVTSTPADPQPLAEIVRGEGLEPTVECVATPADLERALDSGSWDAVLINDPVATLGIQDAIRQVRSRGQHVPCIVITANTTDAFAAEVMRLGASDCMGL